MTNFCLPQPSFVPVKNNLKKDGTSCAACIEPSHGLRTPREDTILNTVGRQKGTFELFVAR